MSDTPPPVDPDSPLDPSPELPPETPTTPPADPPAKAKDSNGHGPGSHLTYYIIGAIVLAVLLALGAPLLAEANAEGKVTPEDNPWLFGLFDLLDLGGHIFLNILKMIVVPLVIASVMSGILGLGDIRKLGKPGGYTVLYYFTTTMLAVGVGMIVVNIIQPGVGFDQEQVQKAEIEGKQKLQELDEKLEAEGTDREEQSKISVILKNLILKLFTDNLLQSAVEADLLPLILFSIVFAGMLTTMGKRAETITKLVVAANDALLNFVLLLMNVAPIGIFCLVAGRFGEAQLQGEFLTVLGQLAWYVITVLVGLSIHAFITLPIIMWIFARRNPFLFIRQMSDALLTAFSTASSSATLPLTIDVAEKEAGVSRRSVEFVLPLGATINMDGTALYEAAAAMFIAQALGYEFTLAQQLTVSITATLAAIGAAGIPEAGLFTMIIVLKAVGLPLEYVSLIVTVDWFLDRFRTTVNVLGDAMGSAVVEKAFPPEEETITAD
ncbi:Excitatory amino acid transporter [Planctomycetales bacterium 10988]|nr:Excitatory amino acid transporter [Planctomycetales bacterium 10988]